MFRVHCGNIKNLVNGQQVYVLFMWQTEMNDAWFVFPHLHQETPRGEPRTQRVTNAVTVCLWKCSQQFILRLFVHVFIVQKPNEDNQIIIQLVVYKYLLFSTASTASNSAMLKIHGYRNATGRCSQPLHDTAGVKYGWIASIWIAYYLFIGGKKTSAVN